MKVENVLSLFDGLSCFQLACKKQGINFSTYYASEVDKHAMKVSSHNFPETIHLGDVTKWSEWDIDWSKIQILVGGSPCQSFSFAGKMKGMSLKEGKEILSLSEYLDAKKDGFEFEGQSYLFWEYVSILNHIKKFNPNVKFILENVRMEKRWENIISRAIGIKPIQINSSLLSAQNRVRNYWTNIGSVNDGLFGDLVCGIKQPKDKGILLKDILEKEVDEKYYLSEKTINSYLAHRERQEAKGNGFGFEVTSKESKSKSVTTKCGSRQDDTFIQDSICVASRGINIENHNSRVSGQELTQHLEPSVDGKTNTLTTVQKDNMVMCIDYRTDEGFRNKGTDKTGTLTAIAREDESCGNLLFIPESTKKGYIEIKPGECFDAENINSSTRRGRRLENKTNTLMANVTNFMQYTTDYRIRRLTPLECRRLQTVRDDYDMSIVSESQQYKMLGNGFTVDVIAYILAHL